MLLPSFKKPPVVEMVLGVQFGRIEELKTAHLGAFWKTLGDNWLNVDEQAPLDPQFEEFPALSWGSMARTIQFTNKPECRLRIRRTSNDRMLQIQNGRLHLNWLGGGDYPSYDTVREEFDELLAEYERFIAAEGLTGLQPNQWEITYVNHIPAGALWNSPSDWHKVIPDIGGHGEVPDMLQLEDVVERRRFELAPQRGRLHIEINGGQTAKDENLLVVKLTARGPANAQGIDGGLNLGHEAIVRTFASMTSTAAHTVWGRER